MNKADSPEGTVPGIPQILLQPLTVRSSKYPRRLLFLPTLGKLSLEFNHLGSRHLSRHLSDIGRRLVRAMLYASCPHHGILTGRTIGKDLIDFFNVALSAIWDITKFFFVR